MHDLEVVVNDPFDPELIGHLYAGSQDLKLASPNAKFPFCGEDWKREFLKDPDNASLLFKLQDKVIGHAAILPTGEDVYLCYVILLPEYRGKNWAEQMVTQSEEFCRLNYPHNYLFLNVEKGNERAKRLYEKMGYMTFAEQEEKYKMRKRLR